VNAHPHTDCSGRIALVHNGIIENYSDLKAKLEKAGHRFSSETDTEVVVHLIEEYYKTSKDPEKAFTQALHNLNGAFGLLVLFADHPDRLFAARRGSPLVLGVAEKGMFVASDVAALLQHTDKVVYLKDNEMAVVSNHDFVIKDFHDKVQEASVEQVYWSLEDLDRKGFAHYMLKEIFEQAASVNNTIRGRLNRDNATSHFGGLNLSPYETRQVQEILILACGTSWHAALVGKYMIEKLSGVSVSVEYASEYRYRASVLKRDTLVVVISQSGETADTLAALREAKRKGARVLGITNVIGSSIARETDGGIYLHAGPEIGVASTKAFTSQLAALLLLALNLGRQRYLSFDEGMEIIEEFEKLPGKISRVLESAEQVKALLPLFQGHNNALYLGRGFNYPVALEGALKLKEISYIHAEGYPAAEMKHGPIALIDKDMPVVFVALKDSIYEKILSNIEEVKARQGRVIVVATEGDTHIVKKSDHVVYVPETLEIFSPILSVIPLQLLAYYIAVERGCSVDQPKNLAKSVTVE
jgi:glucosamine--fructose-6-phosphate aminotransferase (isomerizing)